MACRSVVEFRPAIQGRGNHGYSPLSVTSTIARPYPPPASLVVPVDSSAAMESRAAKCRAKAACANVHSLNVVATLPGGSGGGILEKPALDRGTPGRESEFDLVTRKKSSPPYRVLLHNDNFNRREYVVQVLMKCIPGMTVDNAVNIMQEAHVNGMSVVIICGQDDAEEHCLQLRTNGLVSSIEPASGNN